LILLALEPGVVENTGIEPMSFESTLRETKIRHLQLKDMVCVAPDLSLGDTIATMQARRNGCALVAADSSLIGIFTERDLIRKVVGSSQVRFDRPIRDFMTPEPAVLSPDDSLLDAILLMNRGGYRHIPLVDSANRLCDCLSVINIVDYLLERYPQEVFSLPPRPHQKFAEPDGA
jgi:CBS domain-containing protein